MDYIEQVTHSAKPHYSGQIPFCSVQFVILSLGTPKSFVQNLLAYIAIALQWWVPVLGNPNICASTFGFFFPLSAQSFAANTGALNFWKSLHFHSHLQPWCPDTAKSFPAPHLLLFLIIHPHLGTDWDIDSTHFHCFNKQTNKKIIQGLCCSFKQIEGDAV